VLMLENQFSSRRVINVWNNLLSDIVDFSTLHYCSSDLPDFEELLDESDDRLFRNTLYNSTHTLHTLLPPQSSASQHYHLRRRTHDRQLPTQISHLCKKISLDKRCLKTVTEFVLYA